MRFGQLSVLVNEAAELVGGPLNIMATANRSRHNG
jgi:hypothetical protein